VFFLLIVASGCGFSPVYGTQENTKLPSITLDKIEGRHTYLLDQALRTRLKARGSFSETGGEWLLSYTLSEESQALGINESASSTYSMLTLTTTYTVKRPGDNTVLAQRSRRQRQGYDIVTSTYGSDQTLADARNKAIETMADAIIQDLVFLSKKD
jgi:hypothetical protein